VVSTTSTLAAGSYPLTVTGTSGALVHAAPITLVVIAAAPDFTLTASPTALTLTRAGPSAATTLSIGKVGTFAKPVKLTISGLPTGVSKSLSGTTLVPPATSTLTLSASRKAALGTFTVTVTGTGGGKSHTAAIALTVH